jgi:hypothetical protein
MREAADRPGAPHLIVDGERVEGAVANNAWPADRSVT